jgi:hypothetical protein
MNWTEKEKKKLNVIFKKIKQLGADYNLLLPKTIYIIQTTGEEEGNSSYTRGLNAIIIPKNNILPEDDEWTSLVFPENKDDDENVLDEQLMFWFLYELFQIYCKNNPDIKEKLCNIIGYYKTGILKLPPEIEKRKITFPDVIYNTYYFKGIVENKEIYLMPWFFAGSKFNEQRSSIFTDYMRLGYLVVSPGEECTPVMENEKIQFIKKDNISNYLDMVGYNTIYDSHPEEILAENFILLFKKTKYLPSPKITSKMREILIAEE